MGELMEKKKHVLLLFTDQQRSDTIHALGNDEIVTPALDSIAEGAVCFDRAYTPSPVCLPARLSMLSGQYSNRTGNNNVVFFSVSFCFLKNPPLSFSVDLYIFVTFFSVIDAISFPIC